MAALGLVPSESSSGGKRHQGAITKTGNGHARKKLATTDKLSDNSVIFKRGTTSKCQGILDITMNA